MLKKFILHCVVYFLVSIFIVHCVVYFWCDMKYFVGLMVVLTAMCVGAYIVNSQLVAQSTQDLSGRDNIVNGKFENTEPVNMGSLGDMLRLTLRYFTEKKVHAIPDQALPVSTLTRDDLLALSDDELHVVKFGHSSVLLKVMGEFWLLDPVFGKRASPFSFMGPKRFHNTPMTIDELPDIDKVLVSHNHYDHLDKYSVKKLVAKTKQFLVPIGVEASLEKWGVSAEKIQSFDWWQEMQTAVGKVAFTPTKHFSGRGLTDGNKSLWGSWVIDTPKGKVFFSGDSGYFAGFAEIGNRYGPFDLTFIETGAYDKDWADILMTPEESVQAHLDLQGRVMIPIHNGNFDLAFHAWYEPLERVLAAAQTNQVVLSTTRVGEVMGVMAPQTQERWWQGLIPQQLAM